MEQEIERRVLGFAKKNQNRMEKETGVESSLLEDDVKQYLEQVMHEVQNQKAQSANN
jgi:hypothetical protein